MRPKELFATIEKVDVKKIRSMFTDIGDWCFPVREYERQAMQLKDDTHRLFKKLMRRYDVDAPSWDASERCEIEHLVRALNDFWIPIDVRGRERPIEEIETWAAHVEACLHQRPDWATARERLVSLFGSDA